MMRRLEMGEATASMAYRTIHRPEQTEGAERTKYCSSEICSIAAGRLLSVS